MFIKKLLILASLSILSLNCAEQFPLNQLPYVVFSNLDRDDIIFDRSCAIVNHQHAFFGIFNGYGFQQKGHIVSEYISKSLYKNVVEYGIQEGFAQTDKQMIQELNKEVIAVHGSTASVAFIKDNKINIGHIGDSAIHIVTKDKVLQLSHQDFIQHSNEMFGSEEFKRVMDLFYKNNINQTNISIAFVSNILFFYYLQNKISLTRSFGYRQFSPYMISTPHLTTFDINDENNFLVLTSSVCLESIKYEIFNILQTNNNWRDNCQKVSEIIKSYESTTDNIQVIIINLKLLNEYFQKPINQIENAKKIQESNTIRCGVAISANGKLMQDAHKIEISKDHDYFGVFDGHGRSGGSIAKYLAKNLHTQICSNLSYNISTVIPGAFKAINDKIKELHFSSDNESYYDSDDEIDYRKSQSTFQSGSTGSIVLIIDDNIHVGWVGDSTTMFARGSEFECTQDHRMVLNNPEYNRIYNLHQDRHKNCRKNCQVRRQDILVPTKQADYFRLGSEKIKIGSLAISRGFGDFACMPYLIETPDILSYNKADIDFIIMASDGLWDVVSRQGAFNYVKSMLASGKGCQETATGLLNAALGYWKGYQHKDNITVIVINLKNK
ncbi:MAG: PP2C family protein-serine/threonine phosphatase [Candidatus Babeliales bacterium]|nr:PP2C family protein-serine/threonine phosphatase [Candidatus Babeliales bacterium]